MRSGFTRALPCQDIAQALDFFAGKPGHNRGPRICRLAAAICEIFQRGCHIRFFYQFRELSIRNTITQKQPCKRPQNAEQSLMEWVSHSVFHVWDYIPIINDEPDLLY